MSEFYRQSFFKIISCDYEVIAVRVNPGISDKKFAR